jgi:ubiquinone/menaquinone biosynthesis C-methylase UbiE
MTARVVQARQQSASHDGQGRPTRTPRLPGEDGTDRGAQPVPGKGALPFSAMPDASFLAATRDSYDAMVAEYADMVSGDIEGRTLDRALLAAFAELVRADGPRPVADVGCGPGRITTVLHRLGLDAFGIDLSPMMVELARRTHPQLRFEVGSMLALDLPDASLGGLLAYYSIIHIPRQRRPEVFAEFHRVLAPGGHLMLAYQVGDDTRHLDEAFGKPVSLDFHRQQPHEVAGLISSAGFTMCATITKEPEGTDKTPQGITIARKPTDRTGTL